MTGRFNPQPFQMFLTDASFSNEMAKDFSVTPGVFNLTRYSSVRRVAIEKIIFSVVVSSNLKLDGFGNGAELTTPILYNPITENAGVATIPISTNVGLLDFATNFEVVTGIGGQAYYHFTGVFGDGKPIINFSTGGDLIVTVNDNITTRMLSFKGFLYGYYVD